MDTTFLPPQQGLASKPPFDPRLPSLIAAGVGDPFDLAATLGLPASEFARVRETEAFKSALAKARKELEEHGFTAEYAELMFAQESVMGMVRDLATRYYAPGTTTDQRLKIAEFLEKFVGARRARVAPTKQSAVQQVPGVTIVFQWPDNMDEILRRSQAQIIDAEPTA